MLIAPGTFLIRQNRVLKAREIPFINKMAPVRGFAGVIGAVLFATLAPVCYGTISGAFVMPHGGIAIAPWNLNTTNQTVLQEAWAVHNACVAVGGVVRDLKPDLIFLSTPHGISDMYNFIFYNNPRGTGSADTDNCSCPPCCFNVTISMNTNVTETLVKILQQDKESISSLSAFGPPGESEEPFPLKWGEVIPLYFLKDQYKSTDPSNDAGYKFSNLKDFPFDVVILSQPSRRYTDDVKMIPELLSLGTKLYHILETSSLNIAVVISGDLAHTHSKDGPYGYSPAADPFDAACGQWVAKQSKEALISDASKLVDKALSCGYTGFVMLQGMMEEGGLESWTSKLYANYHPTYYGMMAGSFVRK